MEGGAQLGISGEGHHSPFLRGKKVFLFVMLLGEQTERSLWHNK